jgi:3-deoxy-D-manno-octulosonic-acid transferase
MAFSVMVLFYRMALLCYYGIIRLAAGRNAKAQKWLAGRQGWETKFAQSFRPTSYCCWVHCASLGEFEQARPIIEALKTEIPMIQILLTFFSPSGYEIRKNYVFADYVMYLPLDSPSNARLFIEIAQPKLALFIKYEYWYYYLQVLKQKSIPSILVAAIAHKNSLIFNFFLKKLYRKIFANYTFIFVQDEETFRNLHQKLGVEAKKMKVTGDPRFDRVTAVAKQAYEHPLLAKIIQNRFRVVIGSAWNPDIQLFAQSLPLLFAQFKDFSLSLIIAPHEIDKHSIQFICQTFSSYPILFFSNLERIKVEEIKKLPVVILVIDCVGILNKLYRFGDLCYVGGGFGAGIHNILEAAVYGKKVLFGPNYRKSREAQDLTKLKAAASVRTPKELVLEIINALERTAAFEESQKTAKAYCLQNQGATQPAIELIKKDLGF